MGLSLNGMNLWGNPMPASAGVSNRGGNPAFGKAESSASSVGQASRPNGEQAKIEALQARYGKKAGSSAMKDPNRKADDVLAKVRAENEAHIRGHEQAHQSAAGSLGGSMTIKYDQNGVAVAGQVPISIPPLDKANPEASMKNYQTVRSAALAPGDPSGQDMSVASKAQGLMGQAQVLIDKKRQGCKPKA